MHTFTVEKHLTLIMAGALSPGCNITTRDSPGLLFAKEEIPFESG